MGYTPEECTYRTEKEFKDLVKNVEDTREAEKKKTYNTRYANSLKGTLGESVMLKTKFAEDLDLLIKKRWQGVEGLDAMTKKPL